MSYIAVLWRGRTCGPEEGYAVKFCCLSSMIFLWLKAEGLDLLRMRDDDYGETLRLNQTKGFQSKANRNTGPVPPSPTQTCKRLTEDELRHDE